MEWAGTQASLGSLFGEFPMIGLNRRTPMKPVSVLAAGILALSVVIAATPGLAAPPHVVVRGATRILPPPAYINNYGADWGDPLNFYGSPVSRYYDPIGKVPDMRYYGPPPVDL